MFFFITFASMKVGTEEYARLCGVSMTTVRNWIEKKKIIAERVGGYYVIDINAFPPRPAGKGGRPSLNTLLNDSKKSDVFGLT